MDGQAEDQTPSEAHRPSLLAALPELRQRHLFRVAAAYAVTAWLLIQVVATVGPAFDLPIWVLRAVILAAIAGFLGTMGVLLFRPRRQSGSESPVYLSRRVRIVGATTVLIIAAAAAALTIRSWSAPEQVTLAVLPFADLSPSRDKAFLAEGVAEEILSALGKNPELKVLGRSSSWALQDRARDPEAVRAALGITHLLEGSVRSAGPSLRLSVRLINTRDGSEEWAEDYEGRSEDVFALQDQVAEAVAARLSGNGKSTTIAKAEVTSVDAYNLYLAARQIARTRTEPELKRAYTLARKVVEGQPDFAPGHALLAELIYMLSDGPDSYGTIPAVKARRLSLHHARRAIALAPQAADGYAAYGLVASGDKGIAALRRAIQMDPARSELALWMAISLSYLNRYKDALPFLERAAAIDPLWPAAVSRLAIDLNVAGYRERADQVIDEFEAKGGDKSQVARFRTAGASLSADLSETIRWGEVALKLNPELPYVPRYVRRAYALVGLPPPRSQVDVQLLRKRFYEQDYDAVVAAAPLSKDLWQ